MIRALVVLLALCGVANADCVDEAEKQRLIAMKRGRRLDHWWSDKRATPLVDIASFRIHPEERGGEKPSDHVPVTISVTAAG